MAFKQLYIRGASKVHGPFEPARVRAAVSNGEFTPQHQVSFDGRAWFTAASIWNQLTDARTASPHLPLNTQAASPPPDTVFTAIPVLDGEDYAGNDCNDETQAELLDPKSLGNLARGALTASSITATLLLILIIITVISVPGPNDPPPSISFVDYLTTLVLCVSVGAVILLLIVLFAAVMVALWTRQANLALRAAGEKTLQVSPLLAALWWFIPVFNLVMPFLALREIVDRSGLRGAPRWRLEEARLWINAWWIAALALFALATCGYFYRVQAAARPATRAKAAKVAEAMQFVTYWQIGEAFYTSLRSFALTTRSRKSDRWCRSPWSMQKTNSNGRFAIGHSFT